MFKMVAQFVVDDGGQDLLEYALLSGLVGTAGLLILPAIADQMGSSYKSWVDAVYATSGEPCRPGGCP
jgi:Flp pilus assembly pilin Flp